MLSSIVRRDSTCLREYVNSVPLSRSSLTNASGCRKGKRECNYPGTGSSTKPARRESKSKSSASSPSSPSGDEDGNDEKIPLSAIPDDDEDMDGDTTPTSASVESYKMSGLSNVNSNSPTNESSTAWSRPQRPQPSRSNSKHSIKFSIQQHPRWSTLSKDVKKYVLFHRDNLSYHHYAFKYDGSDFLKSTFLEIALNDSSQALLYAIVAFSCYHYVIAGGDRRMSLETFLQYYNRSIMYLQSALKKKKPSVPTLLTILQLATIEVGFVSLVVSSQHADARKGVSRGLGQSSWTRTSSIPNLDRTIHTSNDYAG